MGASLNGLAWRARELIDEPGPIDTSPTTDHGGPALRRLGLRDRRKRALRAEPESSPTTPPPEVRDLANEAGVGDVSTLKDLRHRAPSASFTPLQRWEGAVLEVRDEVFIARLVDLSGKEPEAEAEIYLEELSPEGRELLREGAVFYWNIGFRDERGQRERVSSIRFRRLPAFSSRDISRARLEAERASKSLGWHRR